MDAEYFSRVRALFERALDLPAEEREVFLREACGGDGELCEDVWALLEADRSLPAGTLVPGPPAPSPERVGPYKILRQIGSGGMSTVHLAVRDDDAFQRRVVVKLVRRDLENPDLERRLRVERQILASLVHPGIAALYDGGTTDGRPYFVMELVEGEPIDRYCDRHQLALGQRVDLFRAVCAAVQYAHQNLIVHRDLKPSNILVTAEGEPKLLDFGIAKLLNPDLSAPEMAATATWQRPMTPLYASPEQISGKMVGTASDIYSLGVLLYELLTGRLPYDFTGKTPLEIEKLLASAEPPRPSTIVARDQEPEGPGGADDAEAIARNRRLRPAELRRQLSGDLDAIVLKALRTSPSRRYSSAGRLAEDLERSRSGLPVLARQGGWRYRTGKLLRRHRVAAAVSASMLALLLAFTAALAHQGRRVARERDQAQLERERKDSVLGLMLQIFQAADPNLGLGASLTVQEAMASSRPELRRRLARQPQLLAEILHTTGRIHLNLGLWEPALEDLREALRLRRGLFGDGHPAVAETLGTLGLAEGEGGDLDLALSMTEEALELARRQRVEGRDLLTALNNRVTVLCYADRYDLAEAPGKEALELARREPERDLQQLGVAVFNQATIALRGERYARAAELYRQSAEILRTLAGEGHLSVARPINNLGSTLRRSGDLGGAERAFREALAIQQASLGGEHPALVPTLNNLGGVMEQTGRPAEALELFTGAHEIYRRKRGELHPRTMFLWLRMGWARLALGRGRAVAEELRLALPRWREDLGPAHGTLGEAEALLAEALTSAGRSAEAEAVLVASFERLLEHGGEEACREAFERLSRHLESTGGEDRVAAFEARLSP